jgi:hypothetical protein
MKALIPQTVTELVREYILALHRVNEGPYSEQAWERLHERREEFASHPAVWYLGEGCSREAYGVFCEDQVQRVLKIETTPYIGSNARERALWDMLKDTQWAKYFFGLYDESYEYPYLIVQDKAETKGSLKDERLFYMKAEELELRLKSQRVHLADVRYSANGVIVDGDVKLFDYGHCRIK